MKEKVIEAAGKTWRALGEKGELNIAQLPKILKEDDTILYQALGWLAREDKINYTVRNKQTFVSLVEAEQKAFKNLTQAPQNQKTTSHSTVGIAVATPQPLTVQTKKRINF